MRLADIRTVIEPAVDPDATLAAFRAEAGTEEPEKFLSYLKEKALVSDAQFASLHANDAIEVTALVSAFAGSGAVADGAAPGSAPSATHYEVLGTLGRGGMGLVYLARDVDLRRKVALKQLGPEVAASGDSVARFVREVQITAQLDHPHIVPVYSLEAGRGGGPCYAMKLVQGKTFGELIEETRAALSAGQRLEGDRTLAARLEAFLKVCDAVAYAHGKGVLHRDLKPANLMLGRWGEVYVMDWGLARLIGSAGEPAVETGVGEEGDSRVHETRLGTVVGTPRYMSPEQVSEASSALDGRSDEYALGLILFELVTLGPAVRGETLTEVVRAAMEGRKEPMVAAVPGAEVPRPLVAIVEKATARRREDRYEDVSAFAADIRRFLHDEEIAAKPDSRAQKLMRLMARHRRATLAGIGGLVLLSALGFVLMLWRRQTLLEDARLRQSRVERFLAEVSRNGETIDAHFLQLQGLLQGLAGAAEHALTAGVPARGGFATTEDFRDPARRPADVFRSRRYGAFVSGENPVWRLPPKVTPLALDQVQRLVPLRRMRRRLFLESQGRAAGDADVPPNELLDGTEMPLVWTLIGLPSGVGSVFPGSDSVPRDWDPTERPWYALAAKSAGPVWGAPHRDTFGTGMVISCSVPLHDDQGRFLGAAAVDLSFDRVARSMLGMPGHPAVEECFLLDGKGDVLVRSRKSGPAASDTRGVVTPEPFPYAAAVPQMRSSETGSTSWTREGKTLLFAWRKLESLGVAYVVVADRTVLEEGETAPVTRRFFRLKRK